MNSRLLAEDLAQPGILRVPGMVHRHRPLRDRVQRKVAVGRCAASSNGAIPERQRVEIGRDALAVAFPAATTGAVALRREAEALQRLDIELQHDRLGAGDQPHRRRGFEIGLVGVLVVAAAPAAVRSSRSSHWRCSASSWCGFGAPLPCCVAVLAAPAGERPDAGLRSCMDDVVGVAAGIARPAVRRRRRPAGRAGRRDRSARPGTAARRGRASTTGWRIASAGPSAPPIGRSSSEMQSQRSR